MNGLPWVVIALKKPGVPARQAFDENLTSYKHPQNGIPQLFWSNAFLIASNGTESRIGTIGAEPFNSKDKSAGEASGVQGIDLSKIDFEKLAKRFEKTKPTSSDLERLKAAVKARLERMVRLNRTRADYLEKFQELIDEYNSGSRNIDEIFKDLVALSRVLTEEQGRHVREHLSEEELTIFDILTRPGPDLSIEERDEVKKIARQLLEKLHELLVLGWRQKVQSRAKVRIEIEDTLEGLPRVYTDELYKKKSDILFEHVYEAYLGEGRSVYAGGV